MLCRRTWRSSCLAATVLAVVVAAPGVAGASIIQSTPSLPPEGYYTAGNICVPLGPGACIVGASLGNFTGTVTTFPLTGQATDSSVTLTAAIYTNNSGMPGTFLGNLMLGGPIGILYSGRSSDTELGTFTSTLTELDLTGAFNGHTIEVVLSPTTSSGPTTVESTGGMYTVSSFFDVFAEISIDGGPFIPGPMRTFTLTPEPGSISLLALGVLGVAGELRRRARGARSR
jgi:hypothetical protein